MNRLSASAVFLLCLLKPIVGLAQAPEQTIDFDLNARCELLEDLKIEDTHILSASVVTDDSDLPNYCRVTGYVLPAVNFEIRLPLEQWNGKFYMTGCGGFCGSVNSDSKTFYLGMNYGLERHYAVSTMDSGHWGESFTDGRWAMNNRIAEIDWAYRAVHETARVSKLVIEAFYGREPEKSYFNGCSTGGRQAVMEALRYPEDFDGIISGCPTLDQNGLSALYGSWVVQSNMGRDGKDKIAPGDLTLIAKAVYDACDEVDGLKDGLIDNPCECKFDPASLLCSDGETSDCLAPEQVETLRAWYGGVKNSAGEQLYPGGVPLGSEPFWEWIIGKTDMSDDGLVFLFARENLRYLAFQEDPGDRYSVTDFDFDNDPQRLEFMSKIKNADNPDLELFRKKGGKLLMYHGWSDAGVPPWTSIEYYEAVEHNVGNREETQAFFRLYMIPGMDHCGILEGPGITDGGVDFLAELEKWVEMGEAPESVLTTKYDDDGNVLWTRPICPYPQRAIYKGQGDINDAANYSCVRQ